MTGSTSKGVAADGIPKDRLATELIRIARAQRSDTITSYDNVKHSRPLYDLPSVGPQSQERRSGVARTELSARG